MEVRRGAALELPHILILIDDKKDELLKTLGERARAGKKVYDTPLMLDSGWLRGWLLDKEADWACLAGGLEKLRSAALTGTFLYAVGDGNHSLAAAKGIWEEYKKTANPAEGPRWVMVELENLYDPALVFEPIHRFIFGAGTEEIRDLFSALEGFSTTKLCGTGARTKLLSLVKEGVPQTRFGIIPGASRGDPEEGGLFLAEAEPLPLAIERLQPLLDRLVQNRPELSVDYIHGEEELFRLARRSAGVGILLPPFNKQGLFRTVAAQGPLPRKSFSMGEAVEKRFYLECRRLFG
jgi:hypothetical protein